MSSTASTLVAPLLALLPYAEVASREVTVHVFAFNLYVVPERAAKKR